MQPAAAAELAGLAQIAGLAQKRSQPPRARAASLAAAAAAAAAVAAAAAAAEAPKLAGVYDDESQKCCPYCGNAVIIPGQELATGVERRPVGVTTHPHPDHIADLHPHHGTRSSPQTDEPGVCLRDCSWLQGDLGKGRYRVRETPRKENRLAQWYQKYGYTGNPRKSYSP